MRGIIVAIIVLFFSNLCYSQYNLNVLDTNNRVKVTYKVGETINFYISDTKSNDTTINTLYTGTIMLISNDSIKINYLNRQNEYYHKKVKLEVFSTYDASNSYNVTYTVAIKDISIIYQESNLKSIGQAMIAIGITFFAVSPIPPSIGMITGNEFNSDLYYLIGGFGFTLAFVGETFNLISKHKLYIANNNALGLEDFKGVKRQVCILKTQKIIIKKKAN